MAIANRTSDFFHFFGDHKSLHLQKSICVSLPAISHDRQTQPPRPSNRNYTVLLDHPRNMCIAMSKVIRQFNFNMLLCPELDSHGNVRSDGSWEASGGHQGKV